MQQVNFRKEHRVWKSYEGVQREGGGAERERENQSSEVLNESKCRLRT